MSQFVTKDRNSYMEVLLPKSLYQSRFSKDSFPLRLYIKRMNNMCVCVCVCVWACVCIHKHMHVCTFSLFLFLIVLKMKGAISVTTFASTQLCHNDKFNKAKHFSSVLGVLTKITFKRTFLVFF